MLERLRPRSAYDIMAAVGFVAAIAGGSAYAAATIGSGDIQRGAVLSRHIKDGGVKREDVAGNAINGAKVANRTITGADVNSSTLGTVPNAAALGGLAGSAFQRRVSGGCTGVSAIASIGADGATACQGVGTIQRAREVFLGNTLPRQFNIDTTGGDLLLLFSGSGFRSQAQGGGDVATWVRVDGTVWASAQVYANETLEHEALVSDFAVVSPLAAGTHPVRVEQHSGLADDHDIFVLTILELPH